MIPLEAVKRAGNASNSALTGDIYTRRWQSKPRKKGQAPVEHELRVNPVGLGLGAVAVGAAALAGGAALWLMQRKLERTDDHYITLVIDEHEKYYTVKSERGMPYKRGTDALTVNSVLTQKQISQGYNFFGPAHADIKFDWGVRHFWQYRTLKKGTFKLGEREGFLS